MTRRLLLCSVTVLACASLHAARPHAPSRYVTDNAGVLSAAGGRALNDTLAGFDRETSNQFLVYIDRHVPDGTTLEAFGRDALNAWHVGQKSKNNGAVLLVFVDDRKMRIAVGYGLEQALTNAKAQAILDDILRPRFRDGDYERGISEGVQAMMDAARDAGFRGTGVPFAEMLRNWSYPIAAVVIWSITFAGLALFWFVRSRLRRRRRARMPAAADGWLLGGDPVDSPGFSHAGSSPEFFSSDASSSGGDFSGGGGGGGDGGASGSW